MLTVKLNDQETHLDEPLNLARALQGWGYQGGGFAVAVNGVFVHRENHPQVVLKNDDEVIVLTPMSGG